MANTLPASPHAQALGQLRDIHLPEPISWWPLAPGWYVIGSLAVITILAILYFIVRYYKNTRAKRQALRLLTAYRQQYQEEGNSQLSAARVSELLKRVALVYFPRAKVASLQGNEWISFLNNSSKGLDFEQVCTELLDVPYQPMRPHDLNLLFQMAHQWIRQRRRPCLN